MVFHVEDSPLRIVADRVRVLVPMLDRLTRSIEDLGVWLIRRKKGTDPDLDYVTFCLRAEDHWS